MQRLFLIGGGLLVVVFALWHPVPRPPVPGVAAPEPSPRRSARLPRAGASAVVVYVAGRVKRPGLYRLAAGSRADDAVRLAGGMLGDADAIAVNLAAQLSDGDEIAVPAVGDSPTRRYRTTPGRRSARTAKKPAAPSPSSVDVNEAGAVQLAAVPGIGPAIARRIVAVRERDGPFGSLDELLDVNGMTASKLDRAGLYLTVGR